MRKPMTNDERRVWRKLPPTPLQCELLRALGIPPSEIESRGEADRLIRRYVPAA